MKIINQEDNSVLMEDFSIPWYWKIGDKVDLKDSGKFIIKGFDFERGECYVAEV